MGVGGHVVCQAGTGDEAFMSSLAAHLQPDLVLYDGGIDPTGSLFRMSFDSPCLAPLTQIFSAPRLVSQWQVECVISGG